MDSHQNFCFPPSDRNQSASRLVTRQNEFCIRKSEHCERNLHFSHLPFSMKGSFYGCSKTISFMLSSCLPGEMKIVFKLHQHRFRWEFPRKASSKLFCERRRHRRRRLEGVRRVLKVLVSEVVGNRSKKRVSALKSMNTLVQPKAFIL